jgi:CubicO group peptidase (beta-lactamase class C family)
MKKLILLFLLPLSLVAQVLSPVVQPTADFDMKKLEGIEALLKSYVEKNHLVGAVTLIVKNNQLVHYKGHGYADLATKKPMPADAIFRIMSQTKALTSLGILQLFEQGKIRLDQPLSDFIPTFKSPRVLKDFNAADSSFSSEPAKREITIRDLLTHSSGIDYAGIGSDKMKAIYTKAGIPSGLGDNGTTLLQAITKLGTLPLIHNPGEKFTYGLNTDVLGCLIEVVSGETLEAYLTKNVFIPLGMKDTYFNLPAEKGSRLPTVYTENEKNEIITWSPTFRGINPDYPLFKKTFFSGGAGLSSTAFDYAIFLQCILNGGKYNGKQILGRRTTELMLSPNISMWDDSFGLGFMLAGEKSANRTVRNKGSFSWGGYYGTTYWADPKEKMIVLIMSQHTPNSHGDYQEKVENIIYGALK